jgi:dTDP-4-dehydrorhamnose reductase
MKIAFTDEGDLARVLARSLKNNEIFIVDNPQRVLKEKPDVVIHTLDIPYFEDKSHIWNFNTWYAINIARAAHKVNATNIYISTFMIFDGKKGYYHENSTPNPINYYGMSKLAGETGAASLGNFLIIRCGVIYSLNYKGFLTPLFKTALNGKNLKCNKNFYISPISIYSLSNIIAKFVNDEVKGIINVGGPRVSMIELCNLIADLFGVNVIEINGKKYDFSLDTWLLNTFNIKLSLKEDLVNAIEYRVLNNEGKGISIT